MPQKEKTQDRLSVRVIIDDGTSEDKTDDASFRSEPQTHHQRLLVRHSMFLYEGICYQAMAEVNSGLGLR